MKAKTIDPHIPELGELLKSLLDWFDIRRDGCPLTFKQVERLAKGKDLSKESVEKVARAVIDAIYSRVKGDAAATGLTDQVLCEWSRNPARMAGLPVDEKGNSVLSKGQILQDMIEFCWRHQFVLAGLEDCKRGHQALFQWLVGFVVPYAASTLVDYYFTPNNPESGMPGGHLWYLPQIRSGPGPNPASPGRILMPSQQVLLWWEDLLGRRLEVFDKQLCGQASDPDNARRQISAWKNEAKPPDSETIRRWTSQRWEYQGTFQDDLTKSLAERWRRCREFLTGKGAVGSSDWVNSAADSPFDPERSLAKYYRGERLEEEIPPFRDYSFKQFLKSPDPIAEGLPVEKLIERVASRWRMPSPVELHSRLMLGRALNLAWNSCTNTLGAKSTLGLLRWAGCCYNHFMTVAGKSNVLSAQEGMRVHCEIADRADPAFHPIAAMFDQGYWISLPGYIRMWIRGEVVFRDGQTELG